MEVLKLAIGGVLLLIGLVIFILEVIGVFRMNYVMNRMHMAAMGDSLGMGSSMLGLMILCGFHFATLKMVLIVLFFWITSPVCAHMLSKLEISTNENLQAYLEKVDNLTAWEETLNHQKEIEEERNNSEKNTDGGEKA